MALATRPERISFALLRQDKKDTTTSTSLLVDLANVRSREAFTVRRIGSIRSLWTVLFGQRKSVTVTGSEQEIELEEGQSASLLFRSVEATNVNE